MYLKLITLNGEEAGILPLYSNDFNRFSIKNIIKIIVHLYQAILPSNQLLLKFNGTSLAFDKTLIQCGIQNGDILKIVVDNCETTPPTDEYKSCIKSTFESKGLPNIGNTCYMNTALQVFMNIPAISKHFLTENYQQPDTFCKLVSEFTKVFWIDDVNENDLSNHLSGIKNYITSKTNQFEGSDQQDSSEFFLYLLQIIHNETKKSLIDTTPDLSRITGDEEGFKRRYLAHGRKLWNTYLKYHNSVISQNLYYMLYTKQTCLENQSHLAIKFDVFSCITLPIPPNMNIVTLNDCFRLFMESNVDESHCSHCNKESKLETITCFLNLPDVLFLQLKRFKFDFYSKSKDTTLVDFPHEIDLKQYIEDDSAASWTYKLIAFSDHVGSLVGGHYTANIKDVRNKENNKWYYFSDSYKEEFIINNKPSKNVFYLVYKRE